MEFCRVGTGSWLLRGVDDADRSLNNIAAMTAECMSAALNRNQLGTKSINKKSELMLMRREKAYSSFCLQIILVYLHPFRRNSFFWSQKSPKNH